MRPEENIEIFYNVQYQAVALENINLPNVSHSGPP